MQRIDGYETIGEATSEVRILMRNWLQGITVHKPFLGLQKDASVS